MENSNNMNYLKDNFILKGSDSIDKYVRMLNKNKWKKEKLI